MLGLPKGIVKLKPHAEYWRQSFAEEAARIREAVGEYIVAIEHVGSTSIEGIAAKPIIDMAAAVESAADGERCVAPLENIGYEYRGEHGIAGRFYFVKGEPRKHHLHLVSASSDFWRSHLLFRNYLRENPATAKEYEYLKLELARECANDRDAYQRGKSDFIKKVLEDAGFSS